MKIEGYPGEWEVKNCQPDNVLVLEKVEPEMPVVEVWVDEDGWGEWEWSSNCPYTENSSRIKEWAWLDVAALISAWLPYCEYLEVSSRGKLLFLMGNKETIILDFYLPKLLRPKDWTKTLVKVVHRA